MQFEVAWLQIVLILDGLMRPAEEGQGKQLCLVNIHSHFIYGGKTKIKQ
jgi:hypothetical protein